jgi:hypothetical protein
LPYQKSTRLQTNTQSTAPDGAEEQAAREANHARLLDQLLGQVTWAEEAIEHAAFEAEIAHIEVRKPPLPHTNISFNLFKTFL